MLYGWLEVGLSNKLLFEHENDEDIVLRTVYNTNKVILGNTVGTNKPAGLYVQGNNVGVHKVPDSNVSLDVYGNMVAKDIQIGLPAYVGSMVLRGNLIQKDVCEDWNGSMELVVSNSNGVATLEYNGSDKVIVSATEGVRIQDNMTVTGDVFAPSFNVTCDARLKKDIFRSDVKEDVTKLKDMCVMDYKLHEKSCKGFLAQDVQKILPSAVQKRKGVIPLHLPAICKGDILELQESHAFFAGDEIILRGENTFIVSVVAVTDNMIQIDHPPPQCISGQVIIDGKLVDDLHTIDTSQIVALNTSVLQDVLARLEKLEKFMYENK